MTKGTAIIFVLAMACFGGYYIFHDGRSISSDIEVAISESSSGERNLASKVAVSITGSSGSVGVSNDSGDYSAVPGLNLEVGDVNGKPERLEVSDSTKFEEAISSTIVKGSINPAAVYPIISAKNFNELLDRLDEASDKTEAASEFEYNVQDYILSSEFNSSLQDSRVSCNNDICMGEFSSVSEDELKEFLDGFLNGDTSPLHANGVVNVYNFTTDGRHGSRVFFNSDSSISGVVTYR
ncbi:hypothetical protein FCL40_07345 [Ferrimonas sediminicola]|uniref:Uncharacterized protein n=1 Tax=Ferrimonas sediminicola TaxID=2569538 RepID=A0A4U1BFQ1_9GAMM|nr:hypothetical protein [Ferrimonas sediminicola]TKB49957.1 hypothetical protein FCL40_07345 [Ferrimonas sediminicola]